jgi:hypothetical protein
MALRDSDNLIIGRGTDSFKITYKDLKDDLNYVPPPSGTINTPTVLAPEEGAGDTTPRPIVTDTITAVDNTAGSYTCETDTIQSVAENTYSSTITSTNPVAGNNPESIFNGTTGIVNDTSTAYIAETITWDLSDFNFGASLDFNIYGGGAGTVEYRVNDDPWVALNDNDAYVWRTFTASSGQITSFEARGGVGAFPGIGAVRVTGSNELLKDGDITLTLSGTKDLDCFEVDDVVQEQITGTITTVDVYQNTTMGGDSLAVGATFVESVGTFAETKALGDGYFTAGNAAAWVYDYKAQVPAGTGLVSEGSHGTAGSQTYGLAYSNDGTNWTVFGADLVLVDDQVIKPLPVAARYIAFYQHQYIGNLTEVVYIKETSLNTVEEVKIVSIPDPQTDPPTIVVDGGNWLGSDGSGTAGGDTTIKGDTTNWDTTLTLAGPTDLDVLQPGDTVSMGDAADVPYQPVSDSIVTVTPDSPSAGQTTLTLSDKTDLAYFRRDDVVQGYNVASGSATGTPWTVNQTPRTWESYWDGTINDAVFAAESSGMYSWTFNDALTGVFVLKRLPAQDAPNARWFIEDGSGVRPFGINDFDSVDNYTLTVSVVNMTAVSIESIASNDASSITFMSLDGRDLKNTAFKIVSINENAKTITVDGGDWYADPANSGDGSGDANGDTEVTCVSPLKAPTNWNVERINEASRQLHVSHATPDDNAQVWVANDNQAGTDFNVTAARTIVGDELLTADVELKSSDFATTPADSDTLKNIVWKIKNNDLNTEVEESASLTNPYKPSLNTGTSYTVSVKHQGNTLDDSEYSETPVTFKTGSSRNLYEYQRAQIESLTTRVGGLEANDVTDDATDTALLTLIAGLAARIQTLEESN